MSLRPRQEIQEVLRGMNARTRIGARCGNARVTAARFANYFAVSGNLTPRIPLESRLEFWLILSWL